VDDNLLVFSSAALGASLQELLYWHDIYKRLDFKKYDKLIKSARYWLIVSTFILATGAVALIWFNGQTKPPLKDVLLFGASLPLLIKQVVRSKPARIKLGSSGSEYFNAP
jgi:hypothetical protein